MKPLRNTFSAIVGAAAAALVAGLPAVSMEPLSLEELDDVRAGFSAGGFDFGSIGQQLTTAIDGTTILSSSRILSDSGITYNQQLHGLSDIVPIERAAQLGLNLPSNALDNGGVIVQGVGGATAVIQTLSDNQIRNLVVNTAQDRTITQQTQLTFVIPNLPDLQQSIQMDKIRMGLDAALTASLISALH